jgi:hypothetical protein
LLSFQFNRFLFGSIVALGYVFLFFFKDKKKYDVIREYIEGFFNSNYDDTPLKGSISKPFAPLWIILECIFIIKVAYANNYKDEV